jgi:hypothetical protein
VVSEAAAAHAKPGRKSRREIRFCDSSPQPKEKHPLRAQ